MDNYHSIETKLWNAISALTSGVLTSLLYDSLSDSSYILEIEGKQYIFTTSGLSFWGAIFSIFATFISLWVVISILIPFVLRMKRRFSYKKINRVNIKEMVRTFEIAKEEVLRLYPIFFPEDSQRCDSELVKLHSRDLAKIILLLQYNFYPPNTKMRARVVNCFRKAEYASFLTMHRRLSAYEFRAIVAMLQRMVACVSSVDNDDLLSKDCTQMKEALSELDDLLAK